MVKHLVALSLLAVCTLSCRTEIKPLIREKAPPKKYFSAPGQGCIVNDFQAATDLPAGSKNLGWVEVKREPTDEASYEKLRKAICAMGGNAQSQMAWVREAGDYEPTRLRANAWVLPP